MKNRIKFSDQIRERWPEDMLAAMERALSACSHRVNAECIIGLGDLVLTIRLVGYTEWAYNLHVSELYLRESVTEFGRLRLQADCQAAISRLVARQRMEQSMHLAVATPGVVPLNESERK